MPVFRSASALSFGGTVTGEHGVGTGKVKYIAEEHGEAYLLMAQLKQFIDPLNIMNPRKLVSVNWPESSQKAATR